LSTESKLQAIKYLSASGGSATLGFNEAWIFSGSFWMVCKVLQPLFYSVVCFTTLARIVKKSGDSFKKDNKKLIVLFYWLSAYLLINTIPVALSFAGIAGSSGWEITSITIFSSTLIICLYLLFNPEVLYGLKGIWINADENHDPAVVVAFSPEHVQTGLNENQTSALETPSPTTDSDIAANNIRKTYLSVRQVEIMDKALNTYMNDSQRFLQQSFSLPQMSKETGFQLQHVSAFLNQHLGESFSDYTNKFRVNYLINLFEQDSNIINRFTLESLGKQAGFGSRSTLISAFKKVTGQTPSAYFRT
jgi:AraC-like DNA-binding protein/uncharacterized membrane protein YtjA (UPF0391 family)